MEGQEEEEEESESESEEAPDVESRLPLQNQGALEELQLHLSVNVCVF